MDFIEYINTWEKAEVLQGKIMIGISILVLVAFVAVIRSEHELLRGSLIPMVLLFALLLGYGGYIIYSRPAHAKSSIRLYEANQKDAIEKEKTKHVNDNKAGKTLIKNVYPLLIIIAGIALFFISTPYYKGMALGFLILFISANVIDYGFVSRSDGFLVFLNTL